MSVDLFFDAVTGQRLQSPANAVPATDIPTYKLGSTQILRVQYLRVFGGKGTPVAAPSALIKFGMKPGTVDRGHYSDTTFDSYAENFTAPIDPAQSGAFYTTALTLDSLALRALFPVAADGTSTGAVDLIAEVLSGPVPSQTFAFRVTNNVIKGPESRQVGVPGPSGYPSPAATRIVVDHASRDYVGENYQAFATRVGSKPANADTLNLFSAGDLAGGTGYVRNVNLWCADLDLTAFSPWNSRGGAQRGGVAITPKHVALANHFPVQVGDTIRFVATNNAIYTRRITAVAQAGASDVLIGTLGAVPGSGDPDELPSAIKPARLLPDRIGSFAAAGLPIFVTNQQKQAHIAIADGSNFPAANWYTTSAAGTAFNAWTGSPADGDSGSPAGFILGGEVYLAFLLHYGAGGGITGGGDSIGHQLAAINAILGPAYALTVPSFTTTRDPAAFHSGDDADFNNVLAVSFNLGGLDVVTTGPGGLTVDGQPVSGGSGGVTSVNGQTGAVTGAQAVAGADIAPHDVTASDVYAYGVKSRNDDFVLSYGGTMEWRGGATFFFRQAGVTTSARVGSISHVSDSTFAIGNGTPGDASGTLLLNSLTASGSGSIRSLVAGYPTGSNYQTTIDGFGRLFAPSIATSGTIKAGNLPTLASLATASTCAGQESNISNPAAGKAPKVISDGTNYLYMDGTVARNG